MPEIPSIHARIAELREAADNARALADLLHEPEAKRGFAEMARRWDAEADALERTERLALP